jgi:hypothetical protein
MPRQTDSWGMTMRKWWPLVAICTGAFMLLIDAMLLS